MRKGWRRMQICWYVCLVGCPRRLGMSRMLVGSGPFWLCHGTGLLILRTSELAVRSQALRTRVSPE